MSTMFWVTLVPYNGPQKQNFELPLSHPAPHLMPFENFTPRFENIYVKIRP